MTIDTNKQLDTVEAYVAKAHEALLSQEKLAKQIHDIDAKYGAEGSDHDKLNAERDTLVRAHGRGQVVLQNLITGRKLVEEQTARAAIEASNRGNDKPLQTVNDLIVAVANEGRNSGRTADDAKAARDELIGRGFQVEATSNVIDIKADAAGRNAGGQNGGNNLISYSNAAVERTANFYGERRAAFGGARKMVTVLQTADGVADKYPNVDYLSMTAGRREEGTARAQQNPPGPRNITLKPELISSGPVHVTVESNRDIPAGTLIVAERGARRAVQKYINDQVTTGSGDGNDDFQGLVTGASAYGGAKMTTANVTWQTLVNLSDAVDPAYLDESHNGDLMLGEGVMQGMPGFMFHKTFETQVKLIRSTTENVPIWMPDITGGFNHMILGYPYVLNQSMAKVLTTPTSTDNIVCLFGDFSTYTLREVPSQTGLRIYSQDMTLQLANEIAVEARAEACGAYLSGFGATNGKSEAVLYLAQNTTA